MLREAKNCKHVDNKKCLLTGTVSFRRKIIEENASLHEDEAHDREQENHLHDLEKYHLFEKRQKRNGGAPLLTSM